MGNNRSCTTSLLDFYDGVSTGLNNKDGWEDCAFFNCQKAFLTVFHKRLIEKLKLQAGIRRRLLKWIVN